MSDTRKRCPETAMPTGRCLASPTWGMKEVWQCSQHMCRQLKYWLRGWECRVCVSEYNFPWRIQGGKLPRLHWPTHGRQNSPAQSSRSIDTIFLLDGSLVYNCAWKWCLSRIRSIAIRPMQSMRLCWTALGFFLTWKMATSSEFRTGAINSSVLRKCLGSPSIVIKDSFCACNMFQVENRSCGPP